MRIRADILARWRAAERAGDADAFDRARLEWAGLDDMEALGVTMTPLHKEQLTEATAPAICRAKNCVVCCYSMAANRVSVGRFNLSPTAIRVKSRTSCVPGVSTPTGGVGYLAAGKATEELTDGQVKGVLRRLTPEHLWTYLDAGSPVIVSILYEPMVGKRCACEDGFDGGHAEYLNAGKVVNGNRLVQVGDPLADGRRNYRKGFGWCDFDLIVRCALARTKAIGEEGIIAVTFADTEGVMRRSRMRVPVLPSPDPTATPLAWLPAGRDRYVRRTVNGKPWANGKGNAWHVIKRLADGADGFVKGEAMEIAA